MNQPAIKMAVRRPDGAGGASATISAEAISILDIEGEINVAAEPVLMDAYNRACAQGARTILLNFSGLRYMNSSGIGLLVTLLIRVRRQNQRLAAYGLNEHYTQIFDLTRLNEAITIFTDEAEALNAVIA